MFIVVDGIDGSGHSTIMKYLADRLTVSGYDVVITAEPTDGALGKRVREILRGEHTVDSLALQMLFVADRLEHIQKIRHWLMQGKLVLCDRYFYSTIAYSEASVGRGWGEKMRVIQDKLEVMRPDLALFVYVDPGVAITRIDHRSDEREHFEYIESLKKISEQYILMSQQSLVFPEVRIINNSGELENAVNEAWREVEELIGRGRLSRRTDFQRI